MKSDGVIVRNNEAGEEKVVDSTCYLGRKERGEVHRAAYGDKGSRNLGEE